MTTETANRTLVCSVLFIDIVGYSKKGVTEQVRIKRAFNAVLAGALEQVPARERVVVDTGDGAAVTFLGDPEGALFVALAVLDAVGEVPVRMGINLGPVSLQVLKASAAASAAIRASAVDAAGARVATEPSRGLRRSNMAPFSAVTFRPLISMDRSDMECSFGDSVRRPSLARDADGRARLAAPCAWRMGAGPRGRRPGRLPG